MKKRNVFLLLGVALVLSLVLAGCNNPATASCDTIAQLPDVSGLKMVTGNGGVEDLSNPIIQLKWKGVNCDATTPEYVVWFRVKSGLNSQANGGIGVALETREHLIWQIGTGTQASGNAYYQATTAVSGITTAPQDAMQIDVGAFNAPQNRAILALNAQPSNAALLPIGSANGGNIPDPDRENHTDDDWYARINVAALLTAYQRLTAPIGTTTQINVITDYPDTVQIELGIQAVVPYNATDVARKFVDPSNVVWTSQTLRIVPNTTVGSGEETVFHPTISGESAGSTPAGNGTVYVQVK